MDGTVPEVSRVLVELGLAIIGLAILARLASHWGFSSIPLYLVAGLAFGNGGLAPLNLSKGFIQLGAEVGVLLLLFMLGLESSGEQLRDGLRRSWLAGVVDLVLNFLPGLATGLLLEWHLMAAILLGGVTWVSSSDLIQVCEHHLRAHKSQHKSEAGPQIVELFHKPGKGEIKGPEPKNGKDVRRVDDKRIAGDCENCRDGVKGEDDIGCLDGNQDEKKRCCVPPPCP